MNRRRFGASGDGKVATCELCRVRFVRYAHREPKFCAGCRERRPGMVREMLTQDPELGPETGRTGR
ncbi:MAG: hypothetical protein GY769_17635 [bacterium]|nr:hypothetical protein [bacterium]